MKQNYGFSLIEMMFILFLASLIVISIPSMHRYFKRQGVQLAVEQLCVDLQLSRLIAIKKKKNCSLQLNRPRQAQYTNSITGAIVNLSDFRGGVQFLDEGPDGGVLSEEITYQRRGMAPSFGSIYIADESLSRIYWVQVLMAGGVSVSFWDGEKWI